MLSALRFVSSTTSAAALSVVSFVSRKMAPDEQGAYDEGMGETNEKIEKWKGSCQDGQCAAGKDAH